jgi:hypothetical protein
LTNGPLLPALPEGFGRAAEKLADTVRHVVDIAVGPDRIRARAQAQADSAVILAEGQARVQDIEARTVERLRKREGRRQRNIESITMKALEVLPPPEQISEKPVSEDWTSRFFEECQDISDEQMQRIWARLLAGEIARPGSFSPRTLTVVRDLTEEDANLFSKLCDFAWIVPTAGVLPIIHDIDAPHVAAENLHVGTLMHLTSLGLAEFNSILSLGIKKTLREIAPSYFGKIHHLKSTDGAELAFDLGHVAFTAVGIELQKISGALGNFQCETAALEEWRKGGWSEEESGVPNS